MYRGATMNNRRMAAMFKAFADENRIQILELLQDGERCACMLLEEMKITQPTLSHHMKILCDSGIVVGRKDGKWMHYSISEEGIGDVRNYLDEILKNSKMGDDRGYGEDQRTELVCDRMPRNDQMCHRASRPDGE